MNTQCPRCKSYKTKSAIYMAIVSFVIGLATFWLFGIGFLFIIFAIGWLLIPKKYFCENCRNIYEYDGSGTENK